MNITSNNTATKLKQVFSTPQQQEIVRLFHSSGLSLSKFCRIHGVALSTVHRWISADFNTSPPPASANSPIGFARLITSASHAEEQSKQDPDSGAANHTDITIALPTGIKISLPVTYDLKSLIKLAGGLGAC